MGRAIDSRKVATLAGILDERRPALDKHLEHPVMRNRRDISEASPNERTMRIMHTDLELDLRLYRRALGLHQDRVRSCL